MKKNMNKRIWFSVISLLIIVCLMNVNIKAADNGTFDQTYTVDSNGDLIPTQHAYLFNGVIVSFNVSNSENDYLSSPEDIYYQEDLDKYYIADTGNKRILECDSSLTNAKAIGEGILKTPRGVFATADGDIYVADYGLQQVVVFSGDTYRTYGKPEHPLYGETVEFKPTRIAVNSTKTMYIVDAGNANGIVQITENGTFSGYFGANYITPSLSYIIKFMFSTKEQKAKLYRSPIAPTNLAFDYDGLLITVTSGLEGNALKRLNIAGNNMFPEDMFYSDDYVDVCVGPTGIICALSKSGYINEYDKEANLLFTFGGLDKNSKINGLFYNPTSIEMNSDFTLFVLDGNKIQIFAQTEFASYVHKALDLYNNGKYEESHEPWEKVLQMNNMFDLAHSGLGKAYLRETNYQKAMEEFKIAKDVSGYSDAFWEVRNTWLTAYATTVLVICFVFIALVMVVKKTKLGTITGSFVTNVDTKIRSIKLIDEILFIFKFIKKPLNSFYELKYHKKMSVLAATFWYVILFVIVVLSNTSVGFVFNTSDVEQISLVRIFSLTILPILLFVIANYLISSITVGNGRFKDVYVATICSFAPVICFLPFVIILSNFLTLNESFLYSMLTALLWGWSFVLLYFMIKDIQELQVGENNKNIFLTVLTMLLFVALAFLVYILSAQLFTFVKEIVLEVLSNA